MRLEYDGIGSRIKDQGLDQGSRHVLRLEYDGIGARSTTADCRLPVIGWKTWRLENLEVGELGGWRTWSMMGLEQGALLQTADFH